MRLRVDDDFYRRGFVNELKQAGYKTLMSGKYLNGNGHCMCPEAANQPPVATPPGWDKYFVMCPVSTTITRIFIATFLTKISF